MADMTMDPALAALLANGLANGNGYGYRGRDGFGAAEVLAIANTVGNTDVLASINASELSTTAMLGNTSREILSGQTIGFRDLVDQTHGVESNLSNLTSNLAVQSATQAAAINLGIERTGSASALAVCELGHQVSDGNKDTQLQALQNKFELSSQLAECCCANKLAIANVLTQMGLQHCELEKLVTADGSTTRALITSNRIDDLQSQLTDSKSAVRDAAIIAAIKSGRHD